MDVVRGHGPRSRSARQRTIGVAALLIAAAGLLFAACGRSGFQYLESDTSGAYAKIPADWSVTSEGFVDFAITGEDDQIRILPGETVVPWKAEFNAAPDATSQTTDHVLGALEVQPVDRRMRGQLALENLFGFDLADPNDGVTVLSQTPTERGELTGLRLSYARTAANGLESRVERIMLTDDRFTTIYDLRLFCGTTCFIENDAVINEIIDTFTVEAD